MSTDQSATGSNGSAQNFEQPMTFWDHAVLEWGPNAAIVDELFAQYLVDESAVPAEWRSYFQEVSKHFGRGNSAAVGAYGNGAASSYTNGSASVESREDGDFRVQQKLSQFVSAYRNRGHFKAKINPLRTGVAQIQVPEDLELPYYGFSERELTTRYPSSDFLGTKMLTLPELSQELTRIYSDTIGFEYTHLLNREERSWLQEQIEQRFENNYQAKASEKRARLEQVVAAELFEEELHKKYVGSKRFSLQGGDSLIAMVNALLQEGAELGVKEIVFGMAHRGRLNMLANIFKKPLKAIFAEFEDQSLFASTGYGDVKYHMGFESDYQGENGNSLRLTLIPNPSHLEFVNPVIEGVVRAKQDRMYGLDRSKVIPCLLHGDAAVIGQGVVYETLNMSLVKGYRTGGTVHIVINNQIGFTTTPEESRSSIYCTDMVKAVEAPVFHVNAEDVDAVCWAMRTALKFRQRYRRDVVVDLYCYRKYGHNEGDDPSFTQPRMYNEIRAKRPISEIYAEQLEKESVIASGELSRFRDAYREVFEGAYKNRQSVVMGEVCPMHGRLRVPTPETGVPLEVLKEVAATLLTYPKDFVIHPKLHKILEKRVQSLEEGEKIEWGMAEGLAYGSLVKGGVNVRLSGQDCGRGTFSHRHLLLDCYETDRTYRPFDQFREFGRFEILNSPLSEAAVLGFEFGFACVRNRSLVLWEAQFGDFVNGAQVIIDQFLASSEAKWAMRSGVVLLLPHGYEGQGPEHSSARLERFLQLAADGNMVVCYPSNAAQYFHLLRRQGLLEIKRPMIIMTPKSLLRSQDASCSVGELTEGSFHTILVDDLTKAQDNFDLICCSGKVYYDLRDALKEESTVNAMVVRFEQLYPFPQFEVKKAFQGRTPRSILWVQEEPENMGSWSYIEPYLRIKLGVEPQYLGRPVSASTATGSPARHLQEQRSIVDELLKKVRLPG